MLLWVVATCVCVQLFEIKVPCGCFQHRADFILGFFCSGVDGLRLSFVSLPPTLFFSFHPLHSFFVSSVLFKGKWRFQSCQACSLIKTVCVFCGLASSYLFLRRMQGGLCIWKGITRGNLLEEASHHHFFWTESIYFLFVCVCLLPEDCGTWLEPVGIMTAYWAKHLTFYWAFCFMSRLWMCVALTAVSCRRGRKIGRSWKKAEHALPAKQMLCSALYVRQNQGHASDSMKCKCQNPSPSKKWRSFNMREKN